MLNGLSHPGAPSFFFFFFFLFTFQFWRFLLRYPETQRVFPQLYSVYLCVHQRHSSCLLQCFSFRHFCFGSSFCSHCPCVLACRLLYPPELFQHIDHLALSSLSGNSDILAISESRDLMFALFLQNVFLAFNISHNFYLISGHRVLGKRNCGE